MRKVLVSACLLGKRVRYDGRTKVLSEHILNQWHRDGRIIAVCPEVESGMSVPRPPAEIKSGDATGVLAGESLVVDNAGNDVSNLFIRGARITLNLCQDYDIDIAVLSESSPSCGSSNIHDGSFSGKKITGQGVTTALLREHGIRVYSQHELVAANEFLLLQR